MKKQNKHNQLPLYLNLLKNKDDFGIEIFEDNNFMSDNILADCYFNKEELGNFPLSSI